MLLGSKTVGTIAYMGGVMNVPEKFCWSWSQMVQYNREYLIEPGEDVLYIRSQISYHSAARNNLVDRARGDWLLMLDTDHSFEPDLAVRMVNLLDKHELDVLTGFYQYRGKPYSPVIFMLNEKKDSFNGIGDWDPKLEILQVDSAGAGCLLVRRRIFDRIKKELKCNPFDVRHPFSEDHSFFFRLHELGIKAHCALHVKANHLEIRELDLDDYDKDVLTFNEKTMVEGRL